MVFIKGSKWAEEIKKKIGLSMKGKSPWNKGMALSEEHKKKISQSKMGTPSWNKGKKLSKEHREKISDGLKRNHQQRREA